jgi:exodeoxyribonuclease-1
LYEGFLPDADRALLRAVRATPPEQLGARTFAFRDPRYAELLFRYRARNWPQTLSLDERARWDAFRQRRLETETVLTTLTRDGYFAVLENLRADANLPPAKIPVLDALESWGREQTAEIRD